MGYAQKNIITCLIILVLTYLFTFPFLFIENWFMGEILKQMENNWLSFFILWICPLLTAIGLIAIFSWVWGYIKTVKEKAVNGYQTKQPNPPNISIQCFTPSIVTGNTGGLKWGFNTNNKKDFLIEADIPVQ
jgi:hypothetical protein